MTESLIIVDNQKAFMLAKSIPDSVIHIAASGMDSPTCVAEYFAAGYHGVLIGEALVKADDPAQFIRACREYEDSH